jgi:hypothetical protein
LLLHASHASGRGMLWRICDSLRVTALMTAMHKSKTI